MQFCICLDELFAYFMYLSLYVIHSFALLCLLGWMLLSCLFLILSYIYIISKGRYLHVLVDNCASTTVYHCISYELLKSVGDAASPRPLPCRKPLFILNFDTLLFYIVIALSTIKVCLTSSITCVGTVTLTWSLWGILRICYRSRFQNQTHTVTANVKISGFFENLA